MTDRNIQPRAGETLASGPGRLAFWVVFPRDDYSGKTACVRFHVDDAIGSIITIEAKGDNVKTLKNAYKIAWSTYRWHRRAQIVCTAMRDYSMVLP